MSVKKPSNMQQKQAPKKPEHQPDLPETVDPLINAQKEAKDANDLVATLQAENVRLFEQNQILAKDDMSNPADFDVEPMVATLTTQVLTRNDVILSLLPSIRSAHRVTDAKALSQEIDAICFAFGIK